MDAVEEFLGRACCLHSIRLIGDIGNFLVQRSSFLQQTANLLHRIRALEQRPISALSAPETFFRTDFKVNCDSRRRFQYFSVFFTGHNSAAGGNDHIGCFRIFLQKAGFPAPEAGFTFRLENVRN